MALAFLAARRKDARTGKTKMQHRHFTTIAVIINDMRAVGVWTDTEINMVAEHFADHLGETNINFNHARFLAACGAATEGA